MIILLGDSTIQNYPLERYPRVGWGQVFPRYLRKEVEVLNFGVGGSSTKSFLEGGHLDQALKYLKPGVYVFIQFGHNDEKWDQRHTEPFGSYQDNLRTFIQKVRERGGIPLLLTPIYRRHFEDNVLRANVHGDYPQAMKALAQAETCPCLDLCEASYRSLLKIGEANSKSLYLNLEPGIYPNYPEGVSDNSHLSLAGGHWICNLVITALNEQNLLQDFILK
jgi:lysophospholipase L1-like esterase